MEKKKQNSGITLIALVITIIVLLILAAISIATLIGENGILEKARKAKEENLIKQYEEEIKLVITDEIAERKIKPKEDVFIQSLETKIQEKEWVEGTKKCNQNGIEETEVEKNNQLIVTTKEDYKITLAVDNEKLTANIMKIEKINEEEPKEDKLTLGLSMTENKITEGTNIKIDVTSARRLKKVELKVGDVVIYSKENINSTTYNKNDIGIDQLEKLGELPFYENITLTLEATSNTGFVETRSIENVKNYTVSTAAQLEELADVVNDGNNLANETIVQVADIDVNPGKWKENEDGTTTFQNGANEWKVIGSVDYDYDSNAQSNIKDFAGTFNGKGYKIEGVYINNINKDIVGLFALNEGIIKNVTLKNSSIKGRYLVGGIVGGNDPGGTIEDCTNYANVSGTRCVGGICSWSSDTLRNNVNHGQILGTSETGWKLQFEEIGGITGWAQGTITKCKNYGRIISTTSVEDKEYYAEGGIVGGFGDSTNQEGEISNCCNFGEVSGSSSGGIVGYIKPEQNNYAISKCYNAKKIEGINSGGIIGWSNCVKVQDCYNTGSIQGTRNAGGISAWLGENSSVINSYNTGIITGSGAKLAGGILGDGLPTLTNCYHLNTSATYAMGDTTSGWGTLGNDWKEHVEVKEETEMKSLAGILGDNWTEDTNNDNSGYPILKWQIEE